MTDESAKSAIRAPLESAFTQARSALKQNLLGGIAAALRGVVNPGFEDIAAAYSDGQAELNDRYDLLSPIQDYGSVFMPSGRELVSAQILPFTQQLGPMRNCSTFNGGLKLHDVGLWDIRAQITVSWVRLLTSDVSWAVTVYRPNGQVFSEQKSEMSGTGALSGTIISSVVVEEPGCYVQVRIDSIATGRGILGGPRWTRLTAQHISREVTGPWGAGNERSDELGEA
ncbi:hypothetical protein [Corynebacterium sp. TAE3-ERU2]|uniref:hypothetical protein n=1 Tax=Corynebacterium sp. TAE3-ERU2 TaxID=2849497 RepID=UPI001C43CF96|nr:hypothetical protein [Corynebacterium sp. TAE3-ERU2]MBV7302938.1 hypothetical protein [Corynebacterium sp. TAE3-ERU2]